MKKFYCPVRGWDCPYWKKEKDGTCAMVEEDDDLVKECDDYYFWGDETDESAYMVYEGH